MFKVIFNQGGMNGPNFIIELDGRLVGYLYNEGKLEDFEALTEKIEKEEQ